MHMHLDVIFERSGVQVGRRALPGARTVTGLSGWRCALPCAAPLLPLDHLAFNDQLVP